MPIWVMLEAAGAEMAKFLECKFVGVSLAWAQDLHLGHVVKSRRARGTRKETRSREARFACPNRRAYYGVHLRTKIIENNI